jgi:histidinol-phosphate aminotransferase
VLPLLPFPPMLCCRADISCHRVQVGCGADELIDLLMRCVLEPGDKIVDTPPTFTMYKFDAAVNAAEVVTVPRLEGFRIDVEGERGWDHACKL